MVTYFDKLNEVFINNLNGVCCIMFGTVSNLLILPFSGLMPCISELYLSNNKLGVNPDWDWLFGSRVILCLKYVNLIFTI